MNNNPNCKCLSCPHSFIFEASGEIICELTDNPLLHLNATDSCKFCVANYSARRERYEKHKLENPDNSNTFLTNSICRDLSYGGK